MRLTREKETDLLYEAKSIDSSTLRGKTSVDSWRKGTCFWPKLNQNSNNVAKFPFLFPKESLFKILCFAVKAEVHPEQQNTLQNTCSLLLEHFWLNAGEQTELIEHLPYFRYWAVRENHHWLHLQHPFAFPQSLFKPFGTKCLMDQLAWRTSVSVGV